MGDVTTFTKKFAFLSNSHSADFEWDGRIYHCCEAAFQSARSLDPYERRRFTAMNGVTAKREGKNLKPRCDWEMMKDSIMEEIVLAKFSQNPKLAKKLIATGDAELIYGNRLQETYWGVDENTGAGENRLGKILMKVRAILNSDDSGRAIEALHAQKESEVQHKKLELQMQLIQVRQQLKELPAYNLIGQTFYIHAHERITNDQREGSSIVVKQRSAEKHTVPTRSYECITVDRREGNFLVFKYRGAEKRAALPGCITQGMLTPVDPEIRESYRQYGMLLEYMSRLEKVLEAME